MAGSLWPAEMSGICSVLTVCTPLSQLDVSLYCGRGVPGPLTRASPANGYAATSRVPTHH